MSDPLNLKIVVLGPAFVGKTCLINRICNGTFPQNSLSTIGAGFFPHTMTIDDTEIDMMLWDTAGEERFQSVAPSLLHGANGMILVFDITNESSFEALQTYLNIFLESAEYDPTKSLPILLLGNKADQQERPISEGKINRWLQTNRIPYYRDVSAFTGEGVSEAFVDFLRGFINAEKDSINSPQAGLRLPKEQPKKQCC